MKTPSENAMLQTHRREFVRALLTGAAGLTPTWRPAGAQGRGPAPITATKIAAGHLPPLPSFGAW